MAVMNGLIDTLNGHTVLFSSPDTRGVTGIVDDKTVLFVFDREGITDTWSDPALGIMLLVRPLQGAFLSRRTIGGASHVGYRASRGNGGVTSHFLVVFNEKRDVIVRFNNVLGFRKEQ